MIAGRIRLGLAVVLAAWVAGCATTKPVDIVYNLYPVNEEGGDVGAFHGTGRLEPRLNTFEMQLPSGETVVGEAVEVDGNRFSYGGVYANSLGLDTPTSVSPRINDQPMARVTPTRNVRPVVAAGYGPLGTRVQCEGYWNRKDLTGLGGCELSNGGLFRYFAIGYLAQPESTQ